MITGDDRVQVAPAPDDELIGGGDELLHILGALFERCDDLLAACSFLYFQRGGILHIALLG